MYLSSLTLAFVVLYSAGAAASDLSSVYVAPGIYAPSADVYVRPTPAYRQPPYAEPGYGYRRPIMGGRACIPRTGIGLWRVRTGLRRAAGLCRPRARLSRALLRARASTLPSVTTLRIATPRRNTTMRWNMRRGRLCPCPTVRGRDATTAMAGGPTAIKAAGTCAGSIFLANRGRGLVDSVLARSFWVSPWDGVSEAIPITPPAHAIDGFRFALPILRTARIVFSRAAWCIVVGCG